MEASRCKKKSMWGREMYEASDYRKLSEPKPLLAIR
jgi:hypothetical protein